MIRTKINYFAPAVYLLGACLLIGLQAHAGEDVVDPWLAAEATAAAVESSYGRKAFFHGSRFAAGLAAGWVQEKIGLSVVCPTDDYLRRVISKGSLLALYAILPQAINSAADKLPAKLAWLKANPDVTHCNADKRAGAYAFGAGMALYGSGPCGRGGFLMRAPLRKQRYDEPAYASSSYVATESGSAVGGSSSEFGSKYPYGREANR